MIRIENLSKTFDGAGGRVAALHDINLTIEDGDIYGSAAWRLPAHLSRAKKRLGT